MTRTALLLLNVAGTAKSADFDFFEYSERPFRVNPFCP